MLTHLAQQLPPRYRLLNVIGTGGMGTVYQVRDRLRGRDVALKHIHQAHELDELDTQQAVFLRASITREFRTLSTLRHPNIVSVLDYGFDAEGVPYFTMEWLRDSATILAISQSLDDRQRTELMIQLFRALFYVHRRSIVHRDLKPNNIHVIQQDGGYQVKVLDFGLSTASGQIADTSGTVFYLAPEVITQKEITPLADLYAAGVLMYQIFAGGFPFPNQSLSQYIAHVLNDPPSLPEATVPEALAKVMDTLLAKRPEDRYPNARATILALNTAMQADFPVETLATRDSFIQSAAFAGRDQELGVLREELREANKGRGRAWLIGGESGVGKSRLLDELRVEALTLGMEVIISRTRQNGENTYGVWLDVMLSLLMSHDLSDDDLAILNILELDLSLLLERELPPAPDLEAQTMNRRIVEILTRMVTRHTKPLLVILEDLHWASDESLQLLDHISQHLDQSRLVLVGTYRNDEAPHIPSRLPHLRMLPLERLDETAVGKIVVSMVGDIEGRGDLVKKLQSETQGNAFFLVEMMRSLAEQAGELHAVAPVEHLAMPERVRDILESRFRRLSTGAQGLLEIAALAGQEIDLRLLRILAPAEDLEMLLQEAAEYHVTEWRHGRWRFAHEKLREQVVKRLQPSQRVPLHRYIADGLEQLYREDSFSGRKLLPAIALNWELAGEADRALPLLILIAQDAFRLAALDDALAAVERAIACDAGSGISEGIARQIMDAYYMRFYAYRQSEKRDQLGITYQDALKLAERMNLPDLYLRAYQLGADAGALTYNPQMAQACARKMLEYATPESGEAFLAYYRLSQGYRMERRFTEAIEIATQPIALIEKVDRQKPWRGWNFETTLHTYFALASFFENINAVAWSFATATGYCHMMQGDYVQAEHHLRRALEEIQQAFQGARYTISLHNLALCLQGHGNLIEAHQLAEMLAEQAPRHFPALNHTADYLLKICLARREARQRDAATLLHELARTNYEEQEIEDAIFCARDALELYRRLEDAEGVQQLLDLLRQMNDPLLTH